MTSRVSVTSTQAQGTGYSYLPSISSDGSRIAFQSDASNLVPWDTNNTDDIFLHTPTPAPPCTTKYCTVLDGSSNNTTNLDASSCDLYTDISLMLSNGPAGQFTYLLIGAGSGVISDPAGALGDLCIWGGFFSRYNKDLGPISSSGSFSTDISNSNTGGPGFGIPNSGGSGIQPGETWNFQYWHRNPIGQPSGFSEAISITFL